MAKYRKKPVIIDADPYQPGMEDGFDIEHPEEQQRADRKPYINTLEGKMYISPGDYIITGVKGERYPCKPDIFESTYEKAGKDRTWEIENRYKNALHGWLNPFDKAAGSYYNGYLNGVRDTLRSLGIKINGVTDEDEEANTHE